jgi:hypothetical protein
VDSDSTVKLSHRNQELNIAEVKMEHRGTYRCVVDNGLKKVQVEGNVTIKGECIKIMFCHGNRKLTQGKRSARFSTVSVETFSIS